MNTSDAVLSKDLSTSIKTISKEMVQTLLEKKQPYLYQETIELFYKNNPNKKNMLRKPSEPQQQAEPKQSDLIQIISPTNSIYSLCPKSNYQETRNEQSEPKEKFNSSSSSLKTKPAKVNRSPKNNEKEVNNSKDINAIQKKLADKMKNIVSQSAIDTLDGLTDSELYQSKQMKLTSFYEKSKMLYRRKIDKLQGQRNKRVEQEIKKHLDKPTINEKSREIIENKFKEYPPLYERAGQIHRKHMTNISLQEKLTAVKEMQGIEEYCIKKKSSKEKNAKNGFDDFIIDQFEWKERNSLKIKMKEIYQKIKKEIETDDRSKKMKTKTKNELKINNPSNLLSGFARLYLDHEIRENKRLQKEKEGKPSFNPTINHHFTSSKTKKDNTTRVPIYNMIGSSNYRKRNNNSSSSSLNNNNSFTNISMANKSGTRKPNTQRTSLTNKCLDNQRNPGRTSIIHENDKKMTTDLQFEADCAIFKGEDSKQNSIKRNNATSNVNKTRRQFGKTQRELSWCNELELASSRPSTNDYLKYYQEKKKENNAIRSCIQSKLYKLNISDSSSNGKQKQQTILSNKGLFYSLFN